MKELDDVEKNYQEQMDNCRFNSSGPSSFHEGTHKRSTSKTDFLQLFQLSTKTAVQEIEQVRWSLTDATFASHVEMPGSLSVHWNSLKENSPESVTGDHEELVLSSESKLESVTKTFDLQNYSNVITYFDAKTPSSIRTCSDYHCTDVLNCCDVLNSSDDLSYSGETTGSYSSDFLEQHKQHLRLHHRNDLFSVDICSLVGQRYLQFQNVSFRFNPDDTMSYDLYCQWPMIEDTTRCLRPRPEPYPVTFRKEVDSSFTHLYKFSRAEQIEFARKVGHWLSRRSRKLQRQMKPCSVSLSRLPTSTLTKYLRCQPVVCLASLSKAMIKKLATKKRVINSSNRRSLKHHKRSVRRVSCASSSSRPFVLLTRCDLKSTKMGKLVEQRQKVERFPLSCLNQSDEMISTRCSSLAVTSHSYGTSNFSDSSSLSCKKLLRKPIVSVQEISSAMAKSRLPSSVSTRACLSSPNHKNQSHGLRMKQSTLNLMAGNCVVLLRNLSGKVTKNRKPSSEVVQQKKKMQQMKIDQCFVTLTDCSRQNSVPIASTKRVQLRRRKRCDPGWMCIKENHSTLTKLEMSVKKVKSFRSNSNEVVLKQNQNNLI